MASGKHIYFENVKEILSPDGQSVIFAYAHSYKINESTEKLRRKQKETRNDMRV